MKRQRMSRGASKRAFRRSSGVKAKNRAARPMRGGFRL